MKKYAVRRSSQFNQELLTFAVYERKMKDNKENIFTERDFYEKNSRIVPDIYYDNFCF